MRDLFPALGITPGSAGACGDAVVEKAIEDLAAAQTIVARGQGTATMLQEE